MRTALILTEILCSVVAAGDVRKRELPPQYDAKKAASTASFWQHISLCLAADTNLTEYSHQGSLASSPMAYCLDPWLANKLLGTSEGRQPWLPRLRFKLSEATLGRVSAGSCRDGQGDDVTPIGRCVPSPS
jgi:hypothetical protein